MNKELKAISLLHPHIFDGDELDLDRFLECDDQIKEDLMLNSTFFKFCKSSSRRSRDYRSC